MAFMMPYSMKGMMAEQSYWRLAQTNLDHLTGTGLIAFSCYFDQKARASDPLKNIMDGYTVTITPELYKAFYTEAADVRAQSYVLVKTMKPSDGQKGFFAAAKDV